MTTTRLMRMPRPARPASIAAALTAILLLAAGCSGGDSDSEADSTPSATPSTPPTAAVAPRPTVNRCFQLSFDEAISYTSETDPVKCKVAHTSRTFAVGDLDTEVDGHLLAVDSDRVKKQVATTCPERFGDYVGGSEEDQRLSMLRTVWFTPTLDEATEGASWYRCDLVALSGDKQLATLQGARDGNLADVLSTEEGRTTFGMCGTAAPDADDFTRVLCGEKHSWRAIEVVDLGTGKYPGEKAAQEAGQSPCEDAGRAVADDPLDFQWGYESPTASQWRDGQTFGRCWAPD